MKRNEKLPPMSEKAYNDYLKELEAIRSKLAKELAEVSDALQTYIASHGGIDNIYASVCCDVISHGHNFYNTGIADGINYIGASILGNVTERRRIKVDIMQKLAIVEEKIKYVKHNKEKIFVEKAPGYELLRGE
jgi:hypothetical protein